MCKKCITCESNRIANIGGKCSDLGSASITIDKFTYDSDYIPTDMNIAGGDYIEFNVCLDCGQIQGVWPLDETQLEIDARKKINELKNKMIINTNFNEDEFFNS